MLEVPRRWDWWVGRARLAWVRCTPSLPHPASRTPTHRQVTDGSTAPGKAAQMRAHPGVDHAEPDVARELDSLPSVPLVQHHHIEMEYPHGHPLGRHAGSCSHGRCLTAEPNDPSYANGQWHLPVISAPSAWELTTGSPAHARICVIDTGRS